MPWEIKKLIYRAAGPIHIGAYSLGYVQTTRAYVPGKAIWGAFTANMTRAYYKYADYLNVGNIFKEDIITSYFFPALDDNLPLLPIWTSAGLFYRPITWASGNEGGNIRDSSFEKRFIKSFGQTAIEPFAATAENESLHESEYICSKIEQDGEFKNVKFIGYLFRKNAIEKQDPRLNWENILNAGKEIFVGGDRKYGWGRFELEKFIDSPGEIFGIKITYSKSDNLVLNLPVNHPLPAHLDVKSDALLKGDIECMAGREYGEENDKKGFGRRISEPRVCWTPGSIWLEEDEGLEIGEYGVLKNREE